MNQSSGLRFLKPVWLPVQLAVITLFLRWLIPSPSLPGWGPAADNSSFRAVSLSLSGILPTQPPADGFMPVPVKVRLRSAEGNEDALGGACPGKAARKPRRMRFLVTAYCPCEKCCGRWAHDHTTASGRSIWSNGGRFVASDTRVLPFHTWVRIPGYAGGRPVPVLDRGGKIKGRRLDVFFRTHEQAMRWGKRWLTCEVVD